MERFLPSLRQKGECFLNNPVHRHEFSRAFRSAGQNSGFTGAEDVMILPLLQNGRVLLRGRMFPHVDVHSRANKHWRLASQVEGTEHVRSEAMGEIGHGVCRGWGYKQKIRPLGQLDVRGNPVRLFILKGGKDRVAGNRVQGEGGDEFKGLGCTDAVHFMTVLDRKSVV